MKKYDLIYMKRVAIFIGVISLLLTAVLMVVALVHDTLSSEFFTCLAPLLVGALVFALRLVRIPSAHRLAKEQIEALGVTFDDTNAKPLYPKSNIFLSDNWMIAGGRLYLHRDYIRRISVKARPWKTRKDYYLLIQCLDGQHKLFVDSSANAKKIKAWFDAA